MDDLISREDALKALDEMSYKSPHESATSVVRKKHFGEILEKFIMQQPSAQQWIPCSERLPEEDGTYFVSGVWENGDVEVGQLQYIADEHRFSNVIYFNVDAWMPLPEPYREEVSDRWMI